MRQTNDTTHRRRWRLWPMLGLAAVGVALFVAAIGAGGRAVYSGGHPVAGGQPVPAVAAAAGHHRSTPIPVPAPATQRRSGIPQQNGGDGDPDNNGGRDDGDGTI